MSKYDLFVRPILRLILLGIWLRMAIIFAPYAMDSCDHSQKFCQANGGGFGMWVAFVASLVLIGSQLVWYRAFINAIKLDRKRPISQGLGSLANAPTITKPVVPSMNLRDLYPVAPEILVGDPVVWIANQDVKVRHFVGVHWNWDYDLHVLKTIIDQEDCDAATAASVFWLSGAAEDFLPFGVNVPEQDDDILIYEMSKSIANRFESGEFVSNGFSFDEDDGSGFELPAKRRAEGLINWDPSYVPTAIAGRAPIFDDFPKQKQVEIQAFLERFGVSRL